MDDLHDPLPYLTDPRIFAVGRLPAVDGFHSYEMEDFVAVGGGLDFGFVHVDGNGIVIFPVIFSRNSHGACGNGSSHAQGNHHFFHRATHFPGKNQFPLP